MKITYEHPEAELIALRMEKSILSGENGTSESVGYEENDPFAGGGN